MRKLCRPLTLDHAIAAFSHLHRLIQQCLVSVAISPPSHEVLFHRDILDAMQLSLLEPTLTAHFSDCG
jgi:hypothetical protein